MLDAAAATRRPSREEIPYLLGLTADLYRTYWGEFLHLAVFEPGQEEQDFEAALARTHRRYFDALRGPDAGRILDVGTGDGAFAAWMADRTSGEVVGIDVSPVHLDRARSRLGSARSGSLRFVEHDAMRVAELPGAPFDAAVCLDTACYLPDPGRALRGLASRLRHGARLLLVDWCRSEQVSPMQQELILDPLYRYWGVAEMATASRHRHDLVTAGFHLLEIADLSSRVGASLERAYGLANTALAVPPTPGQLVRIAAGALRSGPDAVAFLKGQYYAALLAKAAADAGILRYVSFLAERTKR